MGSDPWVCPYCCSSDVSIYGERMICNKCSRVSTTSVMLTDLEDK